MNWAGWCDEVAISYKNPSGVIPMSDPHAGVIPMSDPDAIPMSDPDASDLNNLGTKVACWLLLLKLAVLYIVYRLLSGLLSEAIEGSFTPFLLMLFSFRNLQRIPKSLILPLTSLCDSLLKLMINDIWNFALIWQPLTGHSSTETHYFILRGHLVTWPLRALTPLCLFQGITRAV